MALIELDTENTDQMSEQLATILNRDAGMNLDPLTANPIDTYVLQHPAAPWCFSDNAGQAAMEHRKTYLDNDRLPEEVLDILDEMVRKLWDNPRCMELREKSDYWKIYGGDPGRPSW